MLAKVKGFLSWLAKVHHILCSPRSRDFRHGPLRYVDLFFIPICFPLFDVWHVCCCCYFHLPHQIIYLLCPILIPNCRPRVFVNVYRFSYISTAHISFSNFCSGSALASISFLYQSYFFLFSMVGVHSLLLAFFTL